MRLRRKMIAFGVTIAVLTTGCQKAPENSIVKNKNFDEMISQAQDGENGYVEPESLAEKYDAYKTKIEDKKLGVSVNVDAKVEIPKTDYLSVLRVKQNRISQDFLDKVKETLGINQTLYDGDVLRAETKESVAREIQWTKEEIEEIKADDDYTEEDKEIYIEELNDELKELQKKYEKVPQKVDWSKYISSGKIESIKKLYNQDKDRYQWDYETNPNGDHYYGVTDGNDGNKIALWMQNNEAYGNGLRYYRGKRSYGHVYSVAIGSFYGLDTNYGMWPVDREPTINDISIGIDGVSNVADILKEDTKEAKVTITEEQAKETADKFLKDIGLTDYQCSESGLYNEVLADDESENEDDLILYRKVYYLKYLRSIDGVFVDNGTGSKHEEGWVGDDYVKKDWPGESIDICINDDGIVTFCYNVPIKVTETVIEKANLKGFNEIKDIFEKMVVTKNAMEDAEDKVTIQVNKVVLRYMRISEPDSYDTGLLVPVWDFLGTYNTLYEAGKLGEDGREVSILTVNAIDGTIIDTELGY